MIDDFIATGLVTLYCSFVLCRRQQQHLSDRQHFSWCDTVLPCLLCAFFIRMRASGRLVLVLKRSEYIYASAQVIIWIYGSSLRLIRSFFLSTIKNEVWDEALAVHVVMTLIMQQKDLWINPHIRSLIQTHFWIVLLRSFGWIEHMYYAYHHDHDARWLDPSVKVQPWEDCIALAFGYIAMLSYHSLRLLKLQAGRLLPSLTWLR